MSTPEISPELLAIIVCPACKGELTLTAGAGADELVCGGCGLAYPVRDGIPVLLVDEARSPA
ncbi:MAG: Trm112 family protein [Propionibacteriales bacterium]|nr:Trm112 family protein [Propionibacteriales bacterium]